MNRGDVLPDIGQKRPIAAAKSLEILRRNPMIAGEEGLLEHIPLDPLRREFADIMSTGWSLFISTHELVHSLCGHTTFARHTFAESSRHFDVTVRMHALEMSADCVAAGNVLEQMMKSGRNEHIWSINHGGYLNNRYYYPFLLGITLILRALSADPVPPETFEDASRGTHPHFSIRRHYMAITCGRILARQFPLVRDMQLKAARVSVKVALDANRIWKTITKHEEPLDFWLFGENVERASHRLKIVRQYLMQLNAEYKNLRPLLESHAIWELPPAEDW